MRTLELYSPIMPLPTGTATYFEHIAKRLRASGFPPQYVTIFVDSDSFRGRAIPSSYMGIPVADYRSSPNIVDKHCSRIYFVANNEFHSYVHRSLADADAIEGGRIISVIHDPCCAMLLKHVSYSGTFGFSPDQFVGILSGQYGRRSQKLLDDQNAGNLPQTFDYISHAQLNTLRHSHEIWTHSTYAACKLIAESGQDSHKMPVFRVGSHPAIDPKRVDEIVDLGALAPPEDMLRIGVFGWVARSKRIVEVVRGLSLALDRIPRKLHKKIQLLVVGKLPPTNELDLFGECKKYDVLDQVQVLDYVSDALFAALVGTCDLIFNLRYPSCGETSGTLSHAVGNNTRVVISAYQAFNEEQGSARFPPLLGLEEFFIAGAISSIAEHKLLGSDGDPLARPSRVAGSACPVDKLVLLEGLTAERPV